LCYWSSFTGRRHDDHDYTTATFQQITGRSPRPLAEFLHAYRAEFA
jgi:hypothetical protein